MKFLSTLVTMLLLASAAKGKEVRPRLLTVDPEMQKDLIQDLNKGRHLDHEECIGETDGFLTCITGTLGQTQEGACVDCFFEAGLERDSFTSCFDFETYMCSEYEDCIGACGSCMDEMVEVAECIFDQNQNGLAPCNFGGCGFPEDFQEVQAQNESGAKSTALMGGMAAAAAFLLV